MTYPEVLDFLFSQLPMYQRVGKSAFKKDLTNTIELCRALGDPQKQFPSIHIAGTNGKGSTAHMVAGILQSAGLKVGLYTSPHYRDYRERVKINGKYISKRDVITFIQINRNTIESIQPSFFEMSVGLAFNYFAQERVDIAVIETGLGGRLDSTNIITPLVTTITNIGLDHQAILGNTIPLIAGEKAGIMKSGVPCIIGRRQTDTEPVFTRSSLTNNAPLIYAEDKLKTRVLRKKIDQTDLEIILQDGQTYNVQIPSGVTYNIENCRTAIATINVLNETTDIAISIDHIKDGLTGFPLKTSYLGRWHIKSKEPLVLLDAAHNDDGIISLFDSLSEYSFDKIHIIFGMVNDKSSDKILSLLPVDAKYYFCKPDVPRGKDGAQLKAEALKHNLNGRSYVSCKNALKAAKRAAGKRDLILGTGSSFVVAELV